MHAFWTVLLIPLLLIAAVMTVRLVDHSALNLRSGSAAGIWKIFVVLVTVMLALLLLIDVVMWTQGMSVGAEGSKGQVSLYGVLMRALFYVLTATDFPVLQIWIGTIIGWGYTLRGAKVSSSQDGEVAQAKNVSDRRVGIGQPSA